MHNGVFSVHNVFSYVCRAFHPDPPKELSLSPMNTQAFGFRNMARRLKEAVPSCRQHSKRRRRRLWKDKDKDKKEEGTMTNEEATRKNNAEEGKKQAGRRNKRKLCLVTLPHHTMTDASHKF